MVCIFKDQSIDSSLGSVSSKLPLKSTVNAQISAPLPHPLPRQKTRFSTRYDLRDVYGTLSECDIRSSTKVMFFKVVRVCFSFSSHC